MANALNLESFKVVKSTAAIIRNFIWENRETLSNEMKLFYSSVASMVERNAAKRKGDQSKITEMKEILERVYNIEQYVINSGAISYEAQFA